MSFKVEVIADNSGEWVGNGLRFATEAEGEAYARDLAWRWTAVRETRVVVEDDTDRCPACGVAVDDRRCPGRDVEGR